jgi:hypothetical protein
LFVGPKAPSGKKTIVLGSGAAVVIAAAYRRGWAADARMPDRADVTMLGSFSTVFVGFGSVGADVNETGSRETQ